ncbi:hypothetical protein [Brachybacterium sp. YJGR34]|uniref:hypothetical protein n=1 Tax=Brachybacterium sp. YJGR34 TaxID=2059911 RepID=UPI001300338D|nr:hypothetical protein [Brachybacterium sp. YJGR34]
MSLETAPDPRPPLTLSTRHDESPRPAGRVPSAPVRRPGPGRRRALRQARREQEAARVRREQGAHELRVLWGAGLSTLL